MKIIKVLEYKLEMSQEVWPTRTSGGDFASKQTNTSTEISVIFN